MEKINLEDLSFKQLKDLKREIQTRIRELGGDNFVFGTIPVHTPISYEDAISYIGKCYKYKDNSWYKKVKDVVYRDDEDYVFLVDELMIGGLNEYGDFHINYSSQQGDYIQNNFLNFIEIDEDEYNDIFSKIEMFVKGITDYKDINLLEDEL